MKKVLILAGSNGNNLKLANEFAKEIKAQGSDAEVVDLIKAQLPLYSSEAEKEGIPQEAIDLSLSMQKSSGLVFVAPEYNGGLPPVLTNMIAWVSRSGDENWREAFNGKTTAIGTHSGGGGLHILMAMRAQLSFLGANVLGRQIHTHFSKELSLDSLKAVVNQLLLKAD